MIKANALYYPHMALAAPNWVKGMAMLYENIYRIVPQGEIPDDSFELQPLLEDGTVGTMIDPAPYAAEASEAFLSKLPRWTAAALSHQRADERGLERLHSAKTDEQVRRLFAEVGYRETNGWMHIPTALASNYMLYLARCIATKNNLDLATPSWAPWTATSYFNLNGGAQDFIVPVGINGVEIENPFALFGLIVSAITPLNIQEIPSAKIAEFRTKRAPEIANFRKTVSDLRDELGKFTDPAVRESEILKRITALKKAQRDYHRCADIIKAKGWFGVSFMGVTAPVALAQLFQIPSQETVILGATTLALGGIFNIHNTQSELEKLRKENPVSCLVEMKQTFQQYTTARGGGDMNYHAYNCMEEYVND